MDGTVLSQGTFTQPGTAINQIIYVPSNLDWLRVWNYTQANQATAAAGPNAFMSYWQRSMPNGTGTYLASGAAGAVTTNITANNAFLLFDPSGQSAGALPLIGSSIATTASTNATRPVVSTGTTTGLIAGQTIVRLSNTAQMDVNGVDMVVGAVNAGVSFTLLTATNPLATAPGLVGGAGFYRVINYNALYYPRKRYVCKITQAANAQVSTTVFHGLTPGQAVRFSIPQQSGMTQLNSTQANNFAYATVESIVDDFNFTINIDTTNFTAFTWPTSAQVSLGSQFPEVVPFGENTADALSINAAQVPTILGNQIPNTQTGILADATVNTGILGMQLATGALLPAGVADDVCYWVAGKSAFGGL